MKLFKHWMVGLDLTNMDEVVLGYLNFLSEVIEPERISFIHVIEDTGISSEISDIFPEIEEKGSLEELIREELQKKIDQYFGESGLDIDIIIKEGKTTEAILSALNDDDPDILVLGKKTGYEGEGIVSRKIAKYTHCSLLFVAENSQYQLKDLHIPITFTKSSSRALKQAQQLGKQVGADLHVQHVYEYPKQFFPYIPSEKYSERMNEHLQKKYEKFKKKYELSNVPECIFTVNEDGKEADQIYDLTLRTRADLIVVGARRKTSTAALLTEELADDMADYHFGIPVLIYKDKEEHIGLLRSLFESE